MLKTALSFATLLLITSCGSLLKSQSPVRSKSECQAAFASGQVNYGPVYRLLFTNSDQSKKCSAPLWCNQVMNCALPFSKPRGFYGYNHGCIDPDIQALMRKCRSPKCETIVRAPSTGLVDTNESDPVSPQKVQVERCAPD